MLVTPDGAPIAPTKKLFPMNWAMQASDGSIVRVTLNADGTCSGQLTAMMAAIADLPQDPNGPLLWLLANAISNQLVRNSILDHAYDAGYNNDAVGLGYDLVDTAD